MVIQGVSAIFLKFKYNQQFSHTVHKGRPQAGGGGLSCADKEGLFK